VFSSHDKGFTLIVILDLTVVHRQIANVVSVSGRCCVILGLPKIRFPANKRGIFAGHSKYAGFTMVEYSCGFLIDRSMNKRAITFSASEAQNSCIHEMEEIKGRNVDRVITRNECKAEHNVI
jgi:hypothetical protein